MTRRPLHSSPPSNNANNANNTQNADDAVIGRAFWWSLAVFALVASGIGIAFWLGQQTVEPPLPVEADYVPPQAAQTAVRENLHLKRTGQAGVRHAPLVRALAIKTCCL